MAKDRWHSPMPRVPQPARPNDHNQHYAGGEPVDLHARIWAQYKDIPEKPAPAPASPGCVFCKPSTLPDGVYDHDNSNGFIPTELIKAYGQSALLGGHELDAEGMLPLQFIGGDPLPAMLGTLRLAGVSVSTGMPALRTAVSLVTGNLVGVLAMLWPSSLGDSSLYSDEELQALEQARTRVRLHIEVQPDGSLKGYGFNTQARRDWEMVPVVQFQQRGEQQVADFGDGVTLVWTPAVDTSRASAIPPLQGASQTPAIWIFPPTEQADRIIVNPIYPPEYRDFILVFPADSGGRPLYVVLNVVEGKNYYRAPKLLSAFPDARPVQPKTYVRGGGVMRKRWVGRKGRIYEWDSQHGTVELFNKQGVHLGEFDHTTGEQTKPATPGRTTIRE